MFIHENETVDVKVYCRKVKNQYLAYTENEFKVLAEKEQKKCEPLELKMLLLTWALFNKLQDEALVENAAGEQKFSYRIYKENRLKKLIKEWGAKDKDGKPIPVNENMIVHLAPPIAETILRAYDELSFVSEEEEGK